MPSSRLQLYAGVLFGLTAIVNIALGDLVAAALFGVAAALSLVSLVGARRTRIEVRSDVVRYQPSFGNERSMTKDECASARVVGCGRRAVLQLNASDGRRIGLPLLGPALTEIPEQLRRAGWPIEDARR